MKSFVLVLASALFFLLPHRGGSLGFYYKTGVIIKKNGAYTGKALQVLYTATCATQNGKPARVFEVVKSDKRLYDYFMSEFVLSEVNNTHRVFYPFAWIDSKIDIKDIEADCQRIISDGIKPVDL